MTTTLAPVQVMNHQEWPVQCHSQGILGEGSFMPGGIMVVGIAPGKQEVINGRPFVGPSGQLLDAMLKSTGLGREGVYLTNICCWRPSWPNGGDRDPVQEEIDQCLPRLLREIAIMRPRLIIPLGLTPSHVLYPEREIGVRGSVLWSSQFNCWIMPTYHPSYILRQDDIKQFGASQASNDEDVGHSIQADFVRDFNKINNIMSWPKDYQGPKDHLCTGPLGLDDIKCPDDPDNWHIEVVLDVMKAQYVLDNLQGLVTIDYETDSESPEMVDILSDPLLCVAVSDGIHSWVIPGDVCKGLTWPDSSRDIRWCAHFGLFDGQVARQQSNWPIYLSEDSLLASNSLDERPGVHGLKVLLREYLGVGFYDDVLKPYTKKRMGLVPRELLYLYNGRDSLYTWHLMQYFIKRQVQDNVREFYLNSLIPALNTFIETQKHGMFVNPAEVRKLALEWLPRHIKTSEEMDVMAGEVGMAGMNMGSSDQLADLLYNKLGLPAPKGIVATNRSGDKATKKHPTTAQKALESMKGLHPFVDKLLDYRRLDKMIGTYIIGISNEIKKDGRVHALVKLHGTVTGRLSIVKPALQTIPDENGVGEDFGRTRQIFTAPNDDYVIAQADYTRAEIYVASGHSYDENLLEDLASTDFHKVAASFIFRVPVAQVTKMQRSYAKRLVFGVMYGLDAKAASWKFGVTLKEAQEWMSIFFERYYKFGEWCDRQKQLVIDDGEVQTLFGRKRRFPLITDRKMYDKVARQAINCVIQGDASDATLSSAVELHQSLAPYGGHVLLLVHDSIVTELPKATLNQTLPLLRNTMQSPRHPQLPSIPVELKLGPSWGLSGVVDYVDGSLTWMKDDGSGHMAPVSPVQVNSKNWFNVKSLEDKSALISVT